MVTPEELKKAQLNAKLSTKPTVPMAGNSEAVKPTQPATPAPSPNPTPTPSQVSPNPAIPPYGENGSRKDLIHDLYEAKKQAQMEAIENAYNKNKLEQEAAMEKIPGMYQDRANDLAVQNERKRYNFNQRAAEYGLNSGTAAQADLAFGSQFNRDYGKIQSAQADAMSQAQRDLTQLGVDKDSEIRQLLAEQKYDEAAALMDEAKEQYNRDMNRANLLAKYGDFSGIAILMGDEAAKNMEKVWIAENPLLALNIGKITPEEYARLTGKNPPGTESSGGGGGGGYGDYPVPSPNPGGGEESYGEGVDDATMRGIHMTINSSDHRVAAQKLLNSDVLGKLNEKQASLVESWLDGSEDTKGVDKIYYG